jgi:hypothetical protein
VSDNLYASHIKNTIENNPEPVILTSHLHYFSLITILMLSCTSFLFFKIAAIGGSLSKVAYAYFYTSSCISSTSQTTLFRDPGNTRRIVLAYM